MDHQQGRISLIDFQELDNRFYVNKSTIPNAGNGLFADVPIEKGSLLQIVGVVVVAGGTADQCSPFANAYKFSVFPLDENDQCEYKLIAMGYAALVNHSEQK